jgi:predicted TIM-barrel fold metal-dependent hydrolase
VSLIIDMHIHIASKERPDCKISNAMLSLPAFAYMVVANGINPLDLAQHFDQTIRDHILGALNASTTVKKGVLLALDAVYSEDGRRLEEESHLIVSNDFVRELAATHAKVLFGASVHPNRGHKAGLDEINRCLQGDPRAVLFKWIPNSQVIDPSDRRHTWFYERLAELGVPLLCHTGPEYAIPLPDPQGDHQRLGDPRKLRLALDVGVTVIVAHAATRFFPFEPYHYLDELAAMMQEADRNKQWKLYADISAMCVLCRVGTVGQVLEKIPPHRMVLGSDYPVPVNDMPPVLVGNLTFEEYLEILRIKNPIEKNYRQLLAMGFPASAGTMAAELLPPWALG